MKTSTSKMLLATGMLSLSIWFTASATAAGPTVRVMPDGIKTPTTHTAYAWAGNVLDVWGNVIWGDSASGTYVWDFGDGSAPASGPVTDARNIATTHAYAAAGSYSATLTVTDGNSVSGAAQVRIDVLPVADKASQINLAIERGLKRLYLDWESGSSRWDAAAALSVLALENRGHRPTSADSDIYKATVISGLNYLFSILNWQTDLPYPGAPYDYNPDANNNGGIVTYWDNGDYVHGMIMSAIAAAGSYDSSYPKTDAVHNPALNLTVSSPGSPVDGWRYYDVLDDMVEACAWAQADPEFVTETGYWDYVMVDPCCWIDYVYDEACDCYTEVCQECWDWVWFPTGVETQPNPSRGGWRYSPNNGDSDNSIAQWFGIGLEEAELWGCYAPAWVKSELKDYWLAYSYNAGLGGWGYASDWGVWAAHSGAGLCMMAYVGVPKTDAWSVQAWDSLGAHWNDNVAFGGSVGWGQWETHFGNTPWGDIANYYAMYAIAKAARIARNASGQVSEVTTIGTHDWYAEYSDYLVPRQLGNGYWPGFYAWGDQVATPFAILILERNVGSLRPQAALTASPNPVNAGTTVNFDISGSTHQDSSKYLVSWKLIFDASSGVNWASPNESGNFPIVAPVPKVGGYPQLSSPADYDVTAIVQVTDNFGETAEAVTIVRITTGLVPPVANSGGPYLGRVGEPVTLDGSASYDPNAGGSIVQYEWDLDGNGTYETDAGNSPTFAFTWSTPYSGQVGLRVTDNFGMTSTATSYTEIVVSDLRAVSYPLISYRRVTRTVWEYVFKFEIKNIGTGDATAVSANLQNWPAQVTVIDGAVTFPGTVTAGGPPVLSSDTFTIRMDRSVPVQNRDLNWKVQYTDQLGTTWVLVKFPLL